MSSEPVSKTGRDSVDIVSDAITDKIDSPVYWIALHVVSQLAKAGLLKEEPRDFIGDFERRQTDEINARRRQGNDGNTD